LTLRQATALVLVALAGGCARTPEPATLPAEPYVGHVQPYGREFIVSYHSMFGPRRVLEANISDANRYCQERGLRMMPDEEETARQNGPFVFRCLKPDDPEFGQSKATVAPSPGGQEKP